MADEKITESDIQENNEPVFTERKRLLFFGLPWTFTKYIIKPDVLTTDAGFFRIEENDCYMYKVQDVRLTATLVERMFKLGTVICYTGDVTDKELKLVHIKHAREVKDYILKASETARRKRRTLNTLDIGADGLIDDLDD